MNEWDTLETRTLRGGTCWKEWTRDFLAWIRMIKKKSFQKIPCKKGKPLAGCFTVKGHRKRYFEQKLQDRIIWFSPQKRPQGGIYSLDACFRKATPKDGHHTVLARHLGQVPTITSLFGNNLEQKRAEGNFAYQMGELGTCSFSWA